jgi:hypothetical protein
MINEDRKRVNKFDAETFTKKGTGLGSVNEDELEIDKPEDLDATNESVF